jgi:hypothetical protein
MPSRIKRWSIFHKVYELHYMKLLSMNKEVDFSQKNSTKYETLIIRNKNGNTNENQNREVCLEKKYQN